jgi:hypothetical protein
VQYQIGLCQERLRQPALARATYEAILAALPAASSAETKTPAILRDIQVMVNWRIKHLTWLESTGKQSSIFDAPDSPETTAAASAPAPLPVTP